MKVQIEVEVPTIDCSTGDTVGAPFEFDGAEYPPDNAWKAARLRMPAGWAKAVIDGAELLFCPACVGKLQQTYAAARAQVPAPKPAPAEPEVAAPAPAEPAPSADPAPQPAPSDPSTP